MLYQEPGKESRELCIGDELYPQILLDESGKNEISFASIANRPAIFPLEVTADELCIHPYLK